MPKAIAKVCEPLAVVRAGDVATYAESGTEGTRSAARRATASNRENTRIDGLTGEERAPCCHYGITEREIGFARWREIGMPKRNALRDIFGMHTGAMNTAPACEQLAGPSCRAACGLTQPQN